MTITTKFTEAFGADHPITRGDTQSVRRARPAAAMKTSLTVCAGIADLRSQPISMSPAVAQ